MILIFSFIYILAPKVFKREPLNINIANSARIQEALSENRKEDAKPKIKAAKKPTLIINYSSLPAWAHYGTFIKDAVETEFPGYFEFKVDIDFSSMPKLIIKLIEKGDTNFKTLHSTPDGDPFYHKETQFIGKSLHSSQNP